MRLGPRHPRLAAAGFRAVLPLAERFYAHKQIFRATSGFAAERLASVKAALARGETVYLGGIGAAGLHNSGVALIEVSRERGPRIVCNNEEERFSGKKHTTEFPRLAIDALEGTLSRLGIGPERIAAWLATWDYPAFAATIFRAVLEEFPASLSLLRARETPFMNAKQLDPATRGPRHLGRALGLPAPVPFIGMPHHDNHAWFSFAVSPFARSEAPVMISVLDGTGDLGSISLYVVERGAMRLVRCNHSVFDSLGTYYGVISSTQGGWTLLSSEGRYMGAAAYGNADRKTNAVYSGLRNIFGLEPEGQVYLNRALADWPRDFFRNPYTPELIRILGAPVTEKDLWNPDAVLRVEDIQHRPDTQERLDKAAATQLVFEDALIHVIDFLIRHTGSDRLVLTGGTALNAVGNMWLLEHFDEAYYQRVLGKRARLHLWVPPVPNDAGVTLGAPYLFAYHAGAGVGEPLEHAFYCGSAPTEAEIRSALDAAPDVAGAARRDRRSDGLHHRARRRDRDLPRRGGDGAARAGPSLDRRQSLQPAHARGAQRSRQVPRSDPAACADAYAGGSKALVRAVGWRRRRRLQRVQLYGADGPRHARRARAHPGGDSQGRHRTAADRARERRSADLCLSQGARPTHRSRGRGQYVVQRRRADRADGGAGDRHAAPLERHGRRAHVCRRRRCVRRLAPRSGGSRRRALPALARRMARGDGVAQLAGVTRHGCGR
jgi:predicted NodU family carbamoyl transferase